MQTERIKTSALKFESDRRRFFERPDWLAAIQKSFDIKTEIFEYHNEQIVVEKNDAGLFSNYMGYGGPFGIDRVEEKDLLELLAAIETHEKKKFERVKLYPFVELAPTHHSSFLRKATSILDLRRDVHIEKSARYEKNKSLRHNVLVRPLRREDIDAFYETYLKTTKRVESFYVTPKSLFADIVKLDDCFILGGFRENRLIAGSVFLTSGKWSYYWWNASNEEGRKYSANYLIMDTAIEMLRKQCDMLDMASSHSAAIKRFKEQWGATDVPYWEYQTR